MKINYRDKSYDIEIADKVVENNTLIMLGGEFRSGVKLSDDVLDTMTIIELDKVAKAIKISDKIDGYHSMNKTAKIQAINENR